MKKILFVINTMGQGGAERAMLELMKRMDRKRFKLYFLVMLNRGELFPEVPGFVRILNPHPDYGSVLAHAKPVLAKIVVKKALFHGNVFKNMPWLFQNFLAQKRTGGIQADKLLWKIVSDGTPELPERFDAAIAYLEGGAAYYVADHVRAEKKLAFIHSEYEKSGFTPMLDHGCYDHMDRIYTVSQGGRASFLHMYPAYEGKTHIFYNMINAEWIRKRAMQGEGFTDGFEGFRIVTIGRLHYLKGYDIAIPALKMLKEAGYPMRWYVLGEGPLRRKVEQWIREYGLEQDFVLLGAVKNPYPYLKQCDLYVHATRTEGKSIAIEEAQVLGKAIIASDCPGNREQIRDRENGRLIPLEAKEIQKAVQELFEDEEQRKRYERASTAMDFSKKEQLQEFCRFLEG